MIEEFKKFLLRGNVVDLTVGVIIGVAFGAVITALVEGIFTPLIAAVAGEPDFSAIGFTVNGSRLEIGMFLNAVLSFVIVAAALFFFIVTPVNHLMARARTEAPAEPTLRKCPECLMDVPRAAKRCGHCTSPLPAA
ncbi:MAG: large conductance mechanosensitive channel protein MscL [Dehalococcoidia bacterium]|nr:MAG: large conductance mechanosensitive channel protein MscL [Dehalococcoidia bacterium]